MIEEFGPVTVLCYRHQATLKTLMTLKGRETAKALHTTAESLGLEICGPFYWIYYGVNGDPNTVFTLEMALPVIPSTAIGVPPYEIKALPAFRFVSKMHYGPYETLGDVYMELVNSILVSGGKPSGINRELYLNVDVNYPQNNVTLVQVGVL